MMKSINNRRGMCTILMKTDTVTTYCVPFPVNNDNGHSFLDESAIVSLLKVCAEQKDIQKGHGIHADVREKGLLVKSTFLGNNLIRMYVKCGALDMARQVFGEFPIRNVVSCNTLISGYVQHGFYEEALNVFEWMKHKSINPNVVTFSCILKACGSLGLADLGEQIHSKIIKEGLLNKDSIVGTALIDMHAKFGAIGKAQIVFDSLLSRDVVSWTSFITGFTQHGYGKEALSCFKRMQSEGILPNAFTFASILRACGRVGDIDTGQKVHAEITLCLSLGNDTVLGNALVDMYAKCGAIIKAQRVFDDLPHRNTVSWNALIGGLCQHGYFEKALNFYQQLQSQGLSPDTVTYASILKACGCIGAIEEGKKIHYNIRRRGLIQKDTVLGNVVLDMYAKCGLLIELQRAFNELPVRDMVTWNTVLTGYAEQGHAEETFNYFTRMQCEAFLPNATTLSSLLNACSSIAAIKKGKEIHAEIISEGLLENDSVLGNALLCMYAKCNFPAIAQRVFNELPCHDMITWTTLITAYVQQGDTEQTFNCYEQMQSQGLSLDAVAMFQLLKACGNARSTSKGKETHTQIQREGFLGNNSYLVKALVEMHIKCGNLKDAELLLDEISAENVVSCWNAVIAAYAESDQYGEDALSCYEKMQDEAIPPNAATFASVLKACGNIGAPHKGGEVHTEVIRVGLLVNDNLLGTALVDMYSKCGLLAKAQGVFNELRDRDVFSWTALMAGYTSIGKHEIVLHLFEEMKENHVVPNLVTFTVVLNACSHCGLVNEGEMYFDDMSLRYDIVPTLEHYTCIVGLLANVGYLEKALSIVGKMPSSDYLPVWFTLLVACHKFGNVDFGKLAFEHAIQLDEMCGTAYVYMSSIYANAGMQEEVEKINSMRMQNDVWANSECLYNHGTQLMEAIV